MERTAESSPRSLARMAGIVYLGIIVTGIFSIAYVPAAIIVPDDAVATAHNLNQRATAVMALAQGVRISSLPAKGVRG